MLNIYSTGEHGSEKGGGRRYNWLFLTIFDFTIIFHFKTLFGVIIFSTTSHV